LLESELRDVELSEANLVELGIAGGVLKRVNFERANLTKAGFEARKILQINLANAIVNELYIKDFDIE